jgi:hypothetical protein
MVDYLLVKRGLVVTRLSICIAIVFGGLLLIGSAAPASADDVDEVGLFDPGQGQWHLQGNGAPFYFGNPGDTPFMGDWNGSGESTPGLFRTKDGFVYLRIANVPGPGDISYFFGNPDDVPLVGDFDGNGTDTVSLYRPSEQRIYISNRLGPNGGALGPADFSYVFGNPIDVPFVGDFDGDGIDTIGLHRPSTGEVFLSNHHRAGPADIVMVFGDPADHYVAGDWDGDGIDTPGVFRSSNATFYQRNSNTSGPADKQLAMGNGAFLPVAGNWSAPPGFSVGEEDETLVSRYHVERDTAEGVEIYVRNMQYWPRGFRAGADIEPDDSIDVVNSTGLYDGWDVLSPSTVGEFRRYGPRGNWMHFTLNRPARVAVVWREKVPPPSWLGGWETGGTVIIDGDVVDVYEKSFPAGPVSLGTVEATTQSRHMYLILLAEENGLPSPPPPTPSGYHYAASSPCPPWVHGLHTTTGPDGASYNTWHPQIDPVYWCYFGHEHGSSPDLIPGSPKVPYQYVASNVPQHEPDPGFKEFIFPDMTGNYWVRFVVHANSASARRVCARHHTLYVMVYDQDGNEKFSVGFKNDFGATLATEDTEGVVLQPSNCGYDMLTLAAQVSKLQSRTINVGPESNDYERWDSRQTTASTVNLGMVEFHHFFDIRDPMSHCVDIVCNSVGLRNPLLHTATRRFILMASGKGNFTIHADYGLAQGEYFTDPFAIGLVSPSAWNATRQYAEPGFSLTFARNATAYSIGCVAADPWMFAYSCNQLLGAGNLQRLPHIPVMMLERSLTFN